MIASLLVACATPAPEAAEAPPPAVELRTWLPKAPDGASGSLILQAEAAVPVVPDALPPLSVPGLTFTLDSQEVEVIGGRHVVTQAWTFRGEAGRYVIPALHVEVPGPAGPATADAPALYVDLGAPPDAPKLADIAEPPEVWTLPWGLLAVAGVGGGIVATGLWLAFRAPRRAPPPVVAEPPDVLALRAWDAVRRDPTLDDHGRALALSRLFRDYLEAVLHFPAAKLSTTEILAYLGALPHLEEGNVPRARRLLRATDRVKYADERAGGDLFDDLDSDLRAFVSSTRPYAWGAGGGSPR